VIKRSSILFIFFIMFLLPQRCTVTKGAGVSVKRKQFLCQ